MDHNCQTFKKPKYCVEKISAEELLCKGKSCGIILEQFGDGLCNKSEYLKYLQKANRSLPSWYAILKDKKLVGHAAFRSSNFFLPIVFGKKNLFHIKLKAAVCQNPFLNLSREVFFCLPLKGILDHHKARVLVIYCSPAHYLNHFQKIKLMPGVIRYLGRPAYNHSFIPLDGTFENYCAKFKSNGYKLKRKERRFAKNCVSKMEIKTYDSLENVDEFLICVRHISPKTYQHKLLKVGFNLSDSFADFLQFLAKHGFLRSYVIFDGSYPVAYLFGTLIDGHFTAHKTGYDPDYAKLSPGNVLWFKAIRDLFADKNAVLFDLSEGEYRFKKYFGSETIKCISIYYFRKTIFNFLLILAHMIYTQVHNTIIKKVKLGI